MDNNYKLSNKYFFKNIKFKAITKKAFQKLYNSDNLTQKQLNDLSLLICKDLEVNKINIKFSGTQKKKNRATIEGFFRRLQFIGDSSKDKQMITIYKYTAVRKKQVSNKQALNTLLHELNHYFDYSIFNLKNSIHSAGFYKRISQLKQMLL